jgi:hypothetical protein
MLVSGDADCFFTGGTVSAKDSAGLTTAQAAPALKSWANLRREIEMLFILKPPSGVIPRSPVNCEMENCPF